MPLVVGVAFKPVTKVYYFDPAGHTDLEYGDRVIVETARGRTLGMVVYPGRDVPDSEISGTLKPVLRRATVLDMVQQDQVAHKEPEALAICRERAAALKLDMKIVKVDYAFDDASVLVYFTAEQRIDFRSLVHDIAQALHARVEMRQVGVRDEAKLVDGYGRCGCRLCCATWLRDFTPVSIKMAKQQDLPLNPGEISGVCGRLLCCLSYENDFYTEARNDMPRINSTLMTPEGPGKVKQVHVLRNSVSVLVQGANDTKLMVEVPLTEVSAAPESVVASVDAGDELDEGDSTFTTWSMGDQEAGAVAARDDDQDPDGESREPTPQPDATRPRRARPRRRAR